MRWGDARVHEMRSRPRLPEVGGEPCLIREAQRHGRSNAPFAGNPFLIEGTLLKSRSVRPKFAGSWARCQVNHLGVCSKFKYFTLAGHSQASLQAAPRPPST